MDQAPGEKPESLPQHCPFSGDLVSLARTQGGTGGAVYTVRTAGAHQWSEALPQASHFVVSSSFSPLVTRCPLFTFLGLPLYLNVILPSLVPVRCLAPIQVASPKEQTDQNWFEFFLLRENWLGWDTFPSKLVRMCRSSLSGSGRF